MDEVEMARIRNGQAISRPELFAQDIPQVAVLNERGEMTAVARYEAGAIRPVKVLN